MPADLVERMQRMREHYRQHPIPPQVDALAIMDRRAAAGRLVEQRGAECSDDLLSERLTRVMPLMTIASTVWDTPMREVTLSNGAEHCYAASFQLARRSLIVAVDLRRCRYLTIGLGKGVIVDAMDDTLATTISQCLLSGSVDGLRSLGPVRTREMRLVIEDLDVFFVDAVDVLTQMITNEASCTRGGMRTC